MSRVTAFAAGLGGQALVTGNVTVVKIPGASFCCPVAFAFAANMLTPFADRAAAAAGTALLLLLELIFLLPPPAVVAAVAVAFALMLST